MARCCSPSNAVSRLSQPAPGPRGLITLQIDINLAVLSDALIRMEPSCGKSQHLQPCPSLKLAEYAMSSSKCCSFSWPPWNRRTASFAEPSLAWIASRKARRWMWTTKATSHPNGSKGLCHYARVEKGPWIQRAELRTLIRALDSRKVIVATSPPTLAPGC